MRKIETGIPGFDHVTMGGLPARRATVVAGPAGSGKTVFAAQFLAEGIRVGQPGVFVTLEEPAVDLRANLRTLGWDVEAWEDAGDWRFVDASPLMATGQAAYDIETLAAQIGHAVDATGAERLALDSLTAVLALQQDAGVARQMLRRLVAKLRAMGVTVVLTIETSSGDPDGALSRYGVEEFVADNVVLMRNVREGAFRRRTIEVLKMRGAMHHKGDVPFTVVPGRGLMVLPVRAPRTDSAPVERVSTGNDGLDALTHGGIFRSSSTLLSGPSGTGKTMLATQFAAAAAAAGERVLIMSYEETHEQVLANGAAVGHDFADYERRGLLHGVSRYPEVASLDDHLVEIRDLFDRLEPRRLVVDSLSALERLGSEPSYRGFVIGLTSFVRTAGPATIFTPSSRHLLGVPTIPESHVSGLIDAIIVLRHVETQSELRRSILVLRMRGSSHEHQIRELTIGDNGVVVGEPFTAPRGS